MKFVPVSLTRAMGKKSLTLKKHSPTLLMGAGVVGMVGTVVLASRATLQLEGVLDEIRKDQADLEMVKSRNRPDWSDEQSQQAAVGILLKGGLRIVKLYGPAALVGTLSIGALVGSHRILTNRNAALGAAYTAVAGAFAEYRRRVVDELGPDKDKEFRYGVQEREVIVETKTGPQPEIRRRAGDEAATMYARWFDAQSSPKNFQETRDANMFFLSRVESMLNDRLRARGFLMLNEAHEALGLSHTKAGAVVGWTYDHPSDHVSLGVFDSVENQLDDYMNGVSKSILLDFNVDGVVLDLIEGAQE